MDAEDVAADAADAKAADADDAGGPHHPPCISTLYYSYAAFPWDANAPM